MTARGGRSLAAMDDATLEAALRDFGSALQVPPAPDVSATVAARVTAERHRGVRPGRVRVSLRWALLAAVLAVLALVALAAAGGLGLPGLRIGFVGPSASPSPSTGPSASGPSPSIREPSPAAAAPSASGGASGATQTMTASVPPPAATLSPIGATPTTLDAARRAVTFPVVLPDPVAVGGAVPQVYLDRDVVGGEVVLLYPATADAGGPAGSLPVGPDGSPIAYVLTESAGLINELILGKTLGPGNTITPVEIDGATGLWISGPVHELLVFDGAGDVRPERTRIVGNVLAWVRNETLFRIETPLALDDALRVARSMR